MKNITGVNQTEPKEKNSTTKRIETIYKKQRGLKPSDLSISFVLTYLETLHSGDHQNVMTHDET